MTGAISSPLSLDQLDVVEASKEGFSFEYIKPDGSPSGVFITVLGDNAPSVKEFLRKRLNALRRVEAMATKAGKAAERLVEQDEQFGIELTAVKVVSWLGIAEECTFENAVRLCTINPLVRNQINEAAGDVANFTKAS